MKLLLLLILITTWNNCHAQHKEHIVQRGESFSSIAKAYSITEKELMEANSASAICYVGRKLKIPVHGVVIANDTILPKDIETQLKSNNEKVLTKSSITSYQVGQALWNHKKYEAAAEYLLDAAEHDEERAYFPLYDCFTQGASVIKNETDAVNWLLKAANMKNKSDEGYWRACSVLALRYQEGNGVETNLPKAKFYGKEYRRYAPQNEWNNAEKLIKTINEKAERANIKVQEKKTKTAVPANSNTSTAYNAQSKVVTTEQESQKHIASNSNSRTYKTVFGETTFYPQSDGSSKTYTKYVCVYCHGTKQCSGCQYASMIQSVVSYNFICPMCGGTRICSRCSGKGYTEARGVVDSTGTGYEIDDHGNAVSTGGKMSISHMNPSSMKSTSSTHSMCPDCGGKGYRPQSYTYAAGSSFYPFHNSTGSTCYICGQQTNHYHYRCTTCKRH